MEHIRTWTQEPYRLELFDTHKMRENKYILAYEFYDSGELIFSGSDFYPSHMIAIDSDAAIGALLQFLSLKPGDTYQEYFEYYTPRQLEWCELKGEELGTIAYELKIPH